jgi:hypothetical protein
MELTYDAPQAHAYVGVDSGGPTVVRGVGSDGQAKDDDESDMSAAVARVLECSGGPRITLGRHLRCLEEARFAQIWRYRSDACGSDSAQ